MARLSEPGTPEYDERMKQVRQRLHDGPSTRSRVLVLQIVGILFVIPAIGLIWNVVRNGPYCNCSMVERSLMLLLAVALLLLPGRIAYVVIRRRMRTGGWTLLPTQQERFELAARWTDPTSRSLKILNGEGIWNLLNVFIVIDSGLGMWKHLEPGHAPWNISSSLSLAIHAILFLFFARKLYRWAEKKLAPAT